MYQSPDFVKVELMVKTAFAYTSGCPYDETVTYAHTDPSSTCPAEPVHTFIELMPQQHQCYSVYNMQVLSGYGTGRIYDLQRSGDGA